MAEIIGRKVGMTRVTLDDGKIVPVTLIEATPNKLIQIKTLEKDGYLAIALGYRPLKNPTKVKTYQNIQEFRVSTLEGFEVNQEISVKNFNEVNNVSIQGTSKGKGFQGVIKRHGFSRGPMTHGSRHHRKPGSVGSVKPFSIKPGKKYPGRMGNETVTLHKVPLIKVDSDRNLLALKGPIPGATNSIIKIWST